MIRANVKDESVADVEAAVTTMFSAIEQAEPEGVRYASCRASDGSTFVILLELEEGIDNPLPTVLEFRQFQEGLKDWISGPPVPEQLTVVGSYRLF